MRWKTEGDKSVRLNKEGTKRGIGVTSRPVMKMWNKVPGHTVRGTTEAKSLKSEKKGKGEIQKSFVSIYFYPYRVLSFAS